ncbi:ABC transporter substrate-binding protein (plasmid) [Polaromonas sp. P1-6]|nr:ABC transporter substrate-binding protein [Polaromonas sp. P1-6]
MSFCVTQNSVRHAVLTLAFAGSAAAAQGQDTRITVAGFGGSQQKDFSATLWQPAAAKAGVGLREESHDGSLAQMRVQVQSGKPGWDVVHLGSDDCAIGAAEGLFAPIDYRTVSTDGIQADLRAANWVGMNTYSVVLAWNTEKYKAKPPKNWVDFWNVKDFPGRRALSSTASETTEIALLGDGVAKEKLYPMDVKRALASLAKLKPNVAVWYGTGAQSAQLIKDGEVDMIAIYGSRVSAVIKDGAPVSYTFQDGVLSSGCLAILKGAKNAAIAQKFIANVVSPAIQANIPTMMPYYGPVNAKAYEVKAFPPALLAQSNMSPINKARQVTLDVNWWRDHIKEVVSPFKQLIAN